MWKSFVDVIKYVFTVAEDLNRLRSEVKEIRQENCEISDKLTRIGFELQLMKEREAHEREKREMRDAYETKIQQLELETKLLREHLALPPAPSEEKSEE
jgi:SMC interacting uncharacterized protein involved in chromosome segregation